MHLIYQRAQGENLGQEESSPGQEPFQKHQYNITMQMSVTANNFDSLHLLDEVIIECNEQSYTERLPFNTTSEIRNLRNGSMAEVNQPVFYKER